MSVPHVLEYHIGMICALSKELAAVLAVLDKKYPPLAGVDAADNDTNAYVLGRIHQHNVVVACLPAGVVGTNPAATAATNMARTFKNVRLGLMVGIGGGIPNLPGTDIRFGDVVVSQPNGVLPGVVQYDKVKRHGRDDFERVGSLNEPRVSLLTALSHLQAQHYANPSQVSVYITEAMERNPNLLETGYGRPSTDTDCLQCAYCTSSPSLWWRLWLLFCWLCFWWRCGSCENGRVCRKIRQHNDPVLHYGTIASANSLIKDAAFRDRLRAKYNAKCVEMEAAGLMRDFPCIVIRGICDYADAYKADEWQEYAALAAAAFAKELLSYLVPRTVDREKPIGEILGILERHLDINTDLLEEIKQHHQKLDIRSDIERFRACHQSFRTSTYEEFKNINPKRALNTCEWALNDPVFRRWDESTKNDLIWVSADPGCGKSVLARSLVDTELQRNGDTVCYFFFKDNALQDNLSTALRAVLHQLFAMKPSLIEHALPAFEENGSLIADVEELWRLLLAAVASSAELSVICIFDALDECRDADRSRLIEFLTKFYKDSSANGFSTSSRSSRLKFLVTSRPYSDIQEDFHLPAHLPSIRLRGEDENEQIHKEINMVIKSRVHDMAVRLDLDEQVENQIELKLLGMENRTYLWLYLAFESIKESLRDNLRPDVASIDYLPSSVEDAYERILSKVSKNQEKRDYVFRTLQIIVGARRPLTISEMAIALGISTSPQATTLGEMKIDENDLEARIRQLCGLFVCFKDSRIFLIHQTAKEFLVSKRGRATVQGVWQHCLDPVEIEAEMTRICLDFLSLKDVELMRIASNKIPVYFQRRLFESSDGSAISVKNGVERFLRYCAQHLTSHLRDESSFIRESITIKDVLSKWWQRFFCRNMPLLSSLQKSDCCLNVVSEHMEAVESLMRDKNSHVNSECSNDDLGIAMVLVGSLERSTEESILLNGCSNVDTRSRQIINPLHVASSKGYCCIVNLFLDRGVSIHGRDTNDGTAFHKALEAGQYEVSKFLLDRGADVHTRDRIGETALHGASSVFVDNHKVVKLLLDAGADPCACNNFGETVLEKALRQDRPRVVELLRGRGATERSPLSMEGFPSMEWRYTQKGRPWCYFTGDDYYDDDDPFGRR